LSLQRVISEGWCKSTLCLSVYPMETRATIPTLFHTMSLV